MQLCFQDFSKMVLNGCTPDGYLMFTDVADTQRITPVIHFTPGRLLTA